ncbi:chromosome segregation protein SMC, partial [Gemella sp. GH3]|uniref:chromosome segregation protein SMC n=1 Tax=unclassified Gemella TaxID=2624949 RepID=UPI0015CFB1E2
DNYYQEKYLIDNNILNIEDKLEKLKKNLVNFDNIYNKTKEEEIKFIKNREQVQSLITLFDERSNNKNENIKKLNTDKEEFLSRKSKIEEKISYVTEELADKKEKLKILKNKLKSYSNINDNSLDEIDEKIENLKEQYFNLINEESKLQNEKTLLNKIKNNTNYNIEIVNLEIKNLKNSIESKNNELNILKQDKILLEEQYNKLISDNNNLEKEESYNRDYHRNVLEKITKGEELKRNFSNKKEFLENQNNSLNYYNVGVKEILKNNIEGVHKTVGDIIHFDSKYTTALDITLSSTQQNIIVDTEHIARKCVDHLKKTGKGRATFLPLSNIVSRTIPNHILEDIINEEGFIDIASNLVNYDKNYNSIISYLLGLVIIVDNLKNGNKLAKKLNFKYRIVTLDGQVINSGGSVTGGAIYKNNNSILKNKAELDELSTNLLQIDSKLEKLKQDLITSEKKLINVDEEIENNRNKIQNLEMLLKEKSLKEQLTKENIEKLESNLKNELYKLEDYEGEHSKIIAESDISEKLVSLQEELQNINLQLKEENDRKQRLSKDNQLLQKEINALTVEKETLEESILSRSDYKVSLTDDLNYIDSHIIKINDNLKLLNNEESKFDKEKDIKKLKEFDEKLNIIAKELTKLKNQKDELYLEEEKLNKELKAITNSSENVTIKLENINLQITKLEVKIEQLVSYLVNTYNTTYEKVEEKFLDISVQEISTYKSRVAILKNKISDLGNVNLNAIEEYEEVEKRYNFYKIEIDDLLQSKEKLQETIREIDKEVESRFINTFEKVAVNFDRIYKTLFNGGYAKMTLEEPKDILNTGINIEASPPGKKLQKLSLLSGGEKALTAISLLFAILEIKNSPFVILDEVEAALDEVNVLRFAQFLKKYSLENQFLVITHRRGTMEQMDKLYGVTMKEKGISYIVPLELKNLLEDNYINE